MLPPSAFNKNKSISKGGSEVLGLGTSSLKWDSQVRPIQRLTFEHRCQGGKGVCHIDTLVKNIQAERAANTKALG